MENEQEIRKKVFRRESKRCIAIMAVAILALVFIWSFVFRVPASARIVFLIVTILFTGSVANAIFLPGQHLYRLKRWSLTTGVVTEVVLEDEETYPHTVAKIRYAAEDGHDYLYSRDISNYGDWNKDCGPEVEKMLKEDQTKYTGGKFLVFYSPKKPDKGIVMLEDYINEKSENQ
ncbi:MAG: hypothetical protein J5636_07565 [Clostridiales bacterium]|nr:hypothetical protein [Clostridiales bacterium]